VAKDSSDAYRRYRGFVAIDNVALKMGMGCRGHCTFEGGFCGWTNDEEDDFEWFMVSSISETNNRTIFRGYRFESPYSIHKFTS
jgi:hypothetical protein